MFAHLGRGLSPPRGPGQGEGAQLHPRDPIPCKGRAVEVTPTWDAGGDREGMGAPGDRAPKRVTPHAGPGR